MKMKGDGLCQKQAPQCLPVGRGSNTQRQDAKRVRRRMALQYTPGFLPTAWHLCVPHSHTERALCTCTAVGESGQEGGWDSGLLPLSAPSSLLT